MHLPTYDACANDPFLSNCWKADEKGFFKGKVNANTRFLDRRRVLTAVELLDQHLAEASELPVADLACGTANFGIMMAERGHRVDLVDNEERFFDYAKLKTHSDHLRYVKGDINDQTIELGPCRAVFFGEAIEHMADPLGTLKRLHSLLANGGLLVLTTPNGDFVDCQEPSWEEVKDQTERNEAIANTIGNHVCEFRQRELKELVRQAGFGLLAHELVNSRQISKRHLLRLLPERWLWPLDRAWSKKNTRDGKSYGRIQIVVAQRFR